MTMNIELMTELSKYEVNKEAGGIEVRGSATVPTPFNFFIDSGDVASIYIGGDKVSDVLLKKKSSSLTYTEYEFNSSDAKYLNKFIVDSVTPDKIFTYYLDTMAFDLHWDSKTVSKKATVNSWIVLGDKLINRNTFLLLGVPYYKVTVPITNNQPYPVYPVVVNIVLDDSNFTDWDKINSDGSNILLMDDTYYVLPYWVEKVDLTNHRISIWVRISIIEANATYNVNILYGSSISSKADATKVFDFYDGFETWSGWTTYGSGTLSQSGDYAYNGTYSAKKGSNSDPNGAYKDMGVPAGNTFMFGAWIRRTAFSGANADRIGIIDSSGNGLGVYVDMHGGTLAIETRSNYTGSTIASASLSQTVVNDWYYVQVTYNGTLTAEVYYNGNLIGSVSGSPSSYSAYTYKYFYIFGGYTYYVDDVRFVSPNQAPAVTIGTPSSPITIIPRYSEGVDYHLDPYMGKIYISGSGSIVDGSTITISYDYYDGIDVVDLVKYIVSKYTGLPYVVDEFEMLDDNGNRVRLARYNVNDYVLTALRKLATTVGARVFVENSTVYFLTYNFTEIDDIYDNKIAKFENWKLDATRIVNDIHVFGKDNIVAQEDTFVGDGITTTITLSKIPRNISKVQVLVSGVWKDVPYNDNGTERYSWTVDYETATITFSEPLPTSPAISDPILEMFPDWGYYHKITVTNPNSSDVVLVGKILIDNSSTDSSVIHDFNWDAVKEDGSDIVFAMVLSDGTVVQIPYKFFSWIYGDSAEIWFGGTMSNGSVFTVPANGSVDVYLLYGNPDYTASYKWSDLGIHVLLDTNAKFGSDISTEPLVVDNTPPSASGGGYWGKDYTFYLLKAEVTQYYTTGADTVYAEITSGNTYTGEVLIRYKSVRTAQYQYGTCTPETETYNLNGNSFVWLHASSWAVYRGTIVNNPIKLKSYVYMNGTEVDYANAELDLDYIIVRPDGVSPCTYSVAPISENVSINVRVYYDYVAPLYYNYQDVASIAVYGVRSKNIKLSWVSDRVALKSYAEKYVTAFANPLHIGTMKMPVATYIDHKFTIGNIITVNDVNNGVSGKFLVDKIKISNGVVEANIVEIPSTDVGVIGLLRGTVLFDVDQSDRVRSLEVGASSTVINIG